MTTGIIIQARMGSKRLPGKVLKEVLGKPLLWYLLQRLRQCKAISQIVVATSDSKDDQAIEDFCKDNQTSCFRGSEDDVLERFYQCALYYDMDPIVRITGDCPLIEPRFVDDVVNFYSENSDFDLVKTGPTYPEGFDAEIFPHKNLEAAWQEAELKSQREHVTTFLWENDQRFKIKWLALKKDYSFFRLTVDEKIDFEVVKEVIEELYPQKDVFFNFEDIFLLYQKKPAIFWKNKHVIRNEGYLKSL